MKTAVFVEGQTELILIREMLLRHFAYQEVSIACYTLFSDNKLNATDYSFPAPNEFAETHFQIINVGGDNAVLTRLLNREQELINAGYDLILGLRDMFSENYIKIVKDRTIKKEISDKFIDGHNQQIRSKATRPESIRFHFAVMEAEAWFLGMPEALTRMDNRLTAEYIEEHRKYNIDEIDPETEFFHPANEVKAIYELVGRRYDKSKGDIDQLVNQVTKEDYETLDSGEKCESFSSFYKSLVQR
ncbi:hypothetical protein [Roseivirga thermotolerans]|uniref:DUF4276 family protein n=1 Tax=Roseivirga thermotolerans TaxID=1758176 RepID=A0ABQ3I9A9_9BACT|nr:hypothetical protein [Roseivirga thermotolerans]GHE73123.1 hypothetical protein GCM10011340_32060 [Roseivirga thermotolerans]